MLNSVELDADYLLYLDFIQNEKEESYLSLTNLHILLYYAQLRHYYEYDKPMFDANIHIDDERVYVDCVEERFQYLKRDEVIINMIPQKYPEKSVIIEQRLNSVRRIIPYEHEVILEKIYHWFWSQIYASRTQYYYGKTPPKFIAEDDLYKYCQASYREKYDNLLWGQSIDHRTASIVPTNLMLLQSKNLFIP